MPDRGREREIASRRWREVPERGGREKAVAGGQWSARGVSPETSDFRWVTPEKTNRAPCEARFELADGVEGGRGQAAG